jgi:hypothetical protein
MRDLAQGCGNPPGSAQSEAEEIKGFASVQRYSFLDLAVQKRTGYAKRIANVRVIDGRASGANPR